MNTRILEIRKKAGLSQEAFGAKIGITKSAISKIEKGENSLTNKNIKIICDKFNVNEEWLRTGKGEMYKAENDLLQTLTDELENLDDLDKKIITNYLKLNPKQRDIFKDFLLRLSK